MQFRVYLTIFQIFHILWSLESILKVLSTTKMNALHLTLSSQTPPTIATT